MEYDHYEAIDLLRRTPFVIEAMLHGIAEDWAMNNEGPDTWCPYDIIGHLIVGEKTDWITRMNIILSENTNKEFQTFDRFAQFTESKGKTLKQLLDEFKTLREENISILLSKNLTEADFNKTGIHPKFGVVTLKQLLATWVVHDLSHIAQIARVMAKQYKVDVGPWNAYMPILSK